jgi:hypothetical protein
VQVPHPEKLAPPGSHASGVHREDGGRDILAKLAEFLDLVNDSGAASSILHEELFGIDLPVFFLSLRGNAIPGQPGGTLRQGRLS